MTDTLPLSKMDIAALRAADYVTVRLNRHCTVAEAMAVKEVKRDERNPFATNQYHAIPCAIRVRGHGEAIADASCFESIWLYHGQHTPASTIVNALRVGDLLTFEFYPDAHSNGYVAAAGLHADVLYLYVDRGGRDKRLAFEFATQVCAQNSARMVQGVNSGPDYIAAAQRARETA